MDWGAVARVAREPIAWAQVTSFTSDSNGYRLRVKFPGDRDDSPIGLKMAAYTPTVGDRVLLLEVAPAQWVCLGKYE